MTRTPWAEIDTRDKVDIVLLVASFALMVFWVRQSLKNQQDHLDEVRLTHAQIRGISNDGH